VQREQNVAGDNAILEAGDVRAGLVHLANDDDDEDWGFASTDDDWTKIEEIQY